MRTATTLASLLSGLLVTLLAPAAIAQSATVAVSHNDPDGLIEPGQVVRIAVLVVWQPITASFAGLKGDVLASPNVGAAANLASVFPQSALVNWGTPVGGGIVGLEFGVTVQLGLWCYPWPPPLGHALPGPLLSYDWTAPANSPGPVTFRFAPAPDAPNLRLYLTSTSPAFSEVLTTYVPVTLTVIPAPSALWLAGLPLLSRTPRRRPA